MERVSEWRKRRKDKQNLTTKKVKVFGILFSYLDKEKNDHEADFSCGFHGLNSKSRLISDGMYEFNKKENILKSVLKLHDLEYWEESLPEEIDFPQEITYGPLLPEKLEIETSSRALCMG